MISIQKDSIMRLLNDVKQIIKNPLNEHGIYYSHDDTDMLKGYALIVGPEDTPYFGGYYFFNFNFPNDYPYRPPKLTFCTNGDNIRFNPNLYKCGKVCVSILNTWSGEQWSSCQTISTILLTLITLFNKSPLLNEPGVTKKHLEFDTYNKIITYKNIDISILQVILKNPSIFKKEFEIFYPFILEHYYKNKSKILVFLDKCSSDNSLQGNFYTQIYGMNLYIDYKNLLNKFKNLDL